MPPPRDPRQRRDRRARWAAVVAFLAVGLAAGPASAHTELRSSSPGAGASVGDLRTIDLRFSEAVQLDAAHVWLGDAAGYLPLGPAAHIEGDRSSLTVPVPPMGEGRYEVVWHVVADDGALVEGTVPFDLLPAAAASAPVAPRAATPDVHATMAPAFGLEARPPAVGHGRGPGRVTGAVTRGLLDASLATLVGGLAFVVTVWPQGARLARTRRVLWIAAGVAALASVELATLQHASATGLSLGEALSPSHQWDALGLRTGRIALVRVALLAVSALLASRLARRGVTGSRPAVWSTATAVVALGLAETMVLLGHSTDLGAAAAAARLLHVLGVCTWVGGLVMLLCVVLPRRGVDEMLAVLPRFSTLATAAVAALSAGGVVVAVDLVGGASALPSTGYGRVLLAKLSVVGLLLVAAAASRRHVRSCLAASARPAAESIARPVAVWVGTELGLLVVVLGLTALLVSQAPPG